MALRLAEGDVRRTAVIPLRRLGVWLVVVSFVFIQFVEVTIFTVGSFDVSLQKVVALVVFPVAFVLMRLISLPLPLLIFAGVMILANSAAYIAESDPLNSSLLSANATVFSGFIGATVLYTALRQDENGFGTLGRVWVIFAAATSVLTLGQAVGLLPLWAVSGEALEYRATEIGGLVRGTGLRFDPNYQAFVLVTGIVFARFYLGRMRNAVTLLILLGIAGTSSRMGLLVAVLVWIVATAIQTRSSRAGGGIVFLKVLVTMATLVGIAIGSYLLSPQEIQLYIDQRVEQTSGAYSYLLAGAPSSSVGIDSTADRILLVRASLEVLSENYLLGVGAYKVPEFLYPSTGLKNVAHNTYLEELLIGGLLGSTAIALYGTFIVGAMVRSHAKGNVNTRSFIVTLLFAFGLMGEFLTLNYNSIIWLPLVVALVYSRISRYDWDRD